MAAPDPVRCVRADITTLDVDALVNAANRQLAGGGGVDGAIHSAAGPGLMAELKERYPDGCPTGEARITTGHGLRARHVIHAVGPVWRGGDAGEAQALAGCYRHSLELAAEHELRSLAFSAISTGVYGYPLEAAAEIAVTTVQEHLPTCPSLEDVCFCLFSDGHLAAFEAALATSRGANA